MSFTIKPWEEVVKEIKGCGKHLRDVLRKWVARYSAFTRKEFLRHSLSGGDELWPDLSLGTKLRRRGPHRRGEKSVENSVFAILRDTGVLFNAISIGAPGNKVEDLEKGVRYGFDQGVSHGEGSGISIGELAQMHDEGLGRVPQRRILVEPDAALLQSMLEDLKAGVERAMRDASLGEEQ